MATHYAIIDGPGYVAGNVTAIRSVHRTLAAAQKARAKGQAIIETGDGTRKGQRVYMDTFAGHRWDADFVLRR